LPLKSLTILIYILLFGVVVEVDTYYNVDASDNDDTYDNDDVYILHSLARIDN